MKRRVPDPLDELSREDRALVETYVGRMCRLGRQCQFYLRLHRPDGTAWRVFIHPDEFAFQLTEKGRFFGFTKNALNEVDFWPVTLPELLAVLRAREANENFQPSAA
jgi:hypothetical protein